MPTTITCNLCSASATGTPAEVLAWDKAHEEHCPLAPSDAEVAARDLHAAERTDLTDAELGAFVRGAVAAYPSEGD